jgi:hypothetical protein
MNRHFSSLFCRRQRIFPDDDTWPPFCDSLKCTQSSGGTKHAAYGIYDLRFAVPGYSVSTASGNLPDNKIFDSAIGRILQIDKLFDSVTDRIL